MKNKETSEKASGFSESRRSFIKKSGAAAAGLAAAPTLLGPKVFGKAPAPRTLPGAGAFPNTFDPSRVGAAASPAAAAPLFFIKLLLLSEKPEAFSDVSLFFINLPL